MPRSRAQSASRSNRPAGRSSLGLRTGARLGWTVTASVPTRTAFAGVHKLRSTVLVIAALWRLVLLAALALFARVAAPTRQAEHVAQRAGIEAEQARAEAERGKPAPRASSCRG